MRNELPKTQAATIAILREHGPQRVTGVSAELAACTIKGWNRNAVDALRAKGLIRIDRVEVVGGQVLVATVIA